MSCARFIAPRVSETNLSGENFCISSQRLNKGMFCTVKHFLSPAIYRLAHLALFQWMSQVNKCPTVTEVSVSVQTSRFPLWPANEGRLSVTLIATRGLDSARPCRS